MGIEFFTAIGVADVSMRLGAHGVISPSMSRDRREVPLRLGVFQKGHDTGALDMIGNRYSGQIAEGRVDAHQIDRSAGTGARGSDPRCHPDKGNPGRLLPEGKLPPVFFFPERPTVISPENDDGVLPVRAAFQRIKEPADIGVRVGAGGQVGLDGRFPATALEKLGMVSARIGHFHSSRRNVVEVVLDMRRQLDVFEGKGLVIFPRNHKGEMRLVETASQEEGLIGVRVPDLINAVVGRVPIDDVIVLEVGMHLIDMEAVVLVHAFPISAEPGPGHVIRPFRAMEIHRVVDLSGTRDMVARSEELGAEPLSRCLILLPGVPVLVATGGPGSASSHERASGGLASGHRAVGVGEGDPHRRQPIDVGSFCLRIPAQVTDPMVEVVNRNEEHVGLCGSPVLSGRHGGRERKRGNKKKGKSIHGPAQQFYGVGDDRSIMRRSRTRRCESLPPLYPERARWQSPFLPVEHRHAHSPAFLPWRDLPGPGDTPRYLVRRKEA